MITLEFCKDWYFFVLENDDVTWKPRIAPVVKQRISCIPIFCLIKSRAIPRLHALSRKRNYHRSFWSWWGNHIRDVIVFSRKASFSTFFRPHLNVYLKFLNSSDLKMAWWTSADDRPNCRNKIAFLNFFQYSVDAAWEHMAFFLTGYLCNVNFGITVFSSLLYRLSLQPYVQFEHSKLCLKVPPLA